MWSAMSVLLEKTAFGGHASLQPADPRGTDLFEHPTAACPRSVRHAGCKCTQFRGIGRGWILNELCLELVPQKSPRERGLESKAVDVKCAKTFRFITHFVAEGTFHQKGPKTNHTL